jgi:hypothetical protein
VMCCVVRYTWRLDDFMTMVEESTCNYFLRK